jgi:hypothetical protein
VTILGNLVGASGYRSGMITGKAAFAGINIGGSIIGGDNHESGAIVVYRKCGPVRIAGNIEGGSDAYTGSVSSLGSIASVTAGGSLIGGSGMGSGHIYSGFVLGPVRIGHDFVGGSVSGSASLYYSGFITGDRIVSVFVGGSIRAGVDDSSDGLFYSPAIQSANDIGPIVVRGNIIGTISTDGDPSDGDFTPVIISARGQGAPTATTNVAIQSLTVGGRVEMAQILGGYDFSLVGVNADAQIGAVMVGGDWIASRIVAGGFNGADGVAGTDDDQFLGGGSSAIESKIVSVTIMGQAIGTIDAGDSFGIMAEKIGALKIAGTSYALTEGNDNLPVGATGDLRVVDWF